MKILYISPKGVKKDYLVSSSIPKEIDIGSIASLIVSNISQAYDDVEITLITDIVNAKDYVPEATLTNYDLFLCDLSTANANVTYYAGDWRKA